MKYDKNATDRLKQVYEANPTSATVSSLALEFNVPDRSIIAKLASLGIYQRKQYLNKRGEKPLKKEKYVERIAELLGKDTELLESLEKVNKNVLILLEAALHKNLVEKSILEDLGAEIDSEDV